MSAVLNNGVVSELLRITPEMAELWLEKNNTGERQNRNIRKNLVKNYAEAMTNGLWQINGDTITFDTNGFLVDGQHRLTACVESGMTFETIVCYNVPPESFVTKDIGAPRQPADHLRANGVSYYSLVASALNIHYAYDHGRLASFNGLKLPKYSILDYFSTHENMVRSAAKCNDSKLIPKTQLTFLHYVVSKKHPALADEFVEKCKDGASLQKGDPILLLRNRIVTLKSQRQGQIDRQYVMAIIIKSWNAFLNGAQLNTMRWQRAEAFPKIQMYSKGYTNA